MDRTSPDAQSSEPLDAEETYQLIFFYFVQALGILAMDPEMQCEAEGNFNVAQELKNEILSGQYGIGKFVTSDKPTESMTLSSLRGVTSLRRLLVELRIV